MGLITYGITQRLTLNANNRDKRYALYPQKVQLDAVRVLGCLRPLADNGVLRSRLRQMSLSSPVDEQASEDVEATLRALGQNDIPAAWVLVSRLTSEWAPNQRRAATYALGKIMGRYAVFFIKSQITSIQKQSNAGTEGDRKNYSEAQKQLEELLRLGMEKKWFEGEYYGYDDPHAYELVFPAGKRIAPQ